jgi:glycerol kinase
VREATLLGAAFAAGLVLDIWADDDALAATWRPAQRVEPGAPLDRARWHEAVARAQAWIPELSTVEL